MVINSCFRVNPLGEYYEGPGKLEPFVLVYLGLVIRNDVLSMVEADF